MKHDLRPALLTSVLAAAFAFAANAQSTQGHDKTPAAHHPKSGGQPKTAQGGDKKPAQSGEQPKSGEASAPRAAAAPVSLPVTGATADNAPKAQKDLKAIVHTKTSWVCASCGATHATKGQCEKCKKDLVSQGVTVGAFREARVDPATGKLALTLGTGQSTSLSEIEGALKPEGITLERRKVAVSNYSKLVIAAPADSKDAAAAVQKALDDSKLFTHATAKYDDAKKEYVALVEGVNGTPTYGDVAAAIEKAGSGYKLADMAWTAPCTACAKNGSTQAGCKSCWQS